MKKIIIFTVLLFLSFGLFAQYLGGDGSGYAHQFLANKLPVGDNFQITLNENSQYQFSESDFPFSDEDGYFSGIQIIGLESAGDLEYQNINLLSDQKIANINQLVFKTISNQYGWPYATITFKVLDNEGGLSLNSYNISIYVIHNPLGKDTTLSLEEDTTLNLQTQDFTLNFGQNRAFQSIIIQKLPTKSILKYNDNLAQTNIEYTNLNLLSYASYPDSNGVAYDFFSYQLKDNKGFTSDLTYKIYFNVTPMPDAPLSADTSISFNEDEIFNFSNAHFSFSDVDGDLFGGIYLLSLPSKGNLIYNAKAISVGDTCKNLALLNFQAPQNANGIPYTHFYFKIIDSSPQLSKQIYTLTLNITPVSDNPTTADTTITAYEDQALSFSSTLFNFSDADGDAFAGVQLQSLPAKGSLLYKGQKLSTTGFINDVTQLSFLADANQYASPYTTFKFKVKDASGSFSNQHSLTINVLSVNDLPASQSFSENIKEDIPYYFSPSNIFFSDADGDSLFGIYFTQLPPKGKLFYDSLPLKANQIYSPVDSVYFLNALNQNGAYYAQIPFKVSDASLGLSDSTYIVTLHVDPMPDAPQSANFTANFYEDSLQSLQTLNFPFSDVDGNSMSGLQIDTLPQKGNLVYDNKTAQIGISYSDLSRLYFLAEKDSFGVDYTDFYFKVIDNTLLASDSLYKCQIDVLPVNDPPYKIEFSQNHIAEDKPINTIIGYFKAYDIDSKNFTYMLTSSSDLSDSDNKSFIISDSSLLTGITLDYETQYLYSIHVSAFDSDNASFGTGFLIYVDDVYENGIATHSTDFLLYPNPVINQLNIKSANTAALHYRLINLYGQVIRPLQIIENNRIKVNNLKTGTYILELESKGEIIRKLFIKK